MQLTDVLTATDMNPYYYKFIPIFIKTWKKLFPEINIHIILIANEIIGELMPYKKYIKLFPPIEGMKTSFIAQIIRILYPALIPAGGGILITDMDMIPMNSAYYMENIKNKDNNSFISYRPLSCVGHNEIAICYNIALPSTWQDIFNIEHIHDIKNILCEVNTFLTYKYRGPHAGIHYPIGWIADQLYLHECLIEWSKNKNNKHFILEDITTTYNRLDKINLKITNNVVKNIKLHNYTDFHMPRPYCQYFKLIDYIVNLL